MAPSMLWNGRRTYIIESKHILEAKGMMVIPQGKGRATKTRARATKVKSPVKSRNAPAAALADPRYHARVVRNAKAYSRKDTAKPGEDEGA